MVCSDQSTLDKEHDKLGQIFWKNGYSNQLFEKAKQQYTDKRAKANSSNSEGQKSPNISNSGDKKKIYVLKIPYVGGISLAFSKRLKTLLTRSGEEIRVVHQTTKVQDSFVLKDLAGKEMLTKVVYEFSCQGDPDTKYIGFTNRTLKERIKEHVSGQSAISDHITVCTYCDQNGVTINNFKILKRCRTKEETPIYEALAIKDKKPILNKNLIKPGKTHTLRVFD